jgi:hypothetical protein
MNSVPFDAPADVAVDDAGLLCIDVHVCLKSTGKTTAHLRYTEGCVEGGWILAHQLFEWAFLPAFPSNMCPSNEQSLRVFKRSGYGTAALKSCAARRCNQYSEFTWFRGA